MNDNLQSISWPGWETVGLIGRGSFGAVYEIQRDVLGDVEKAALKVISIPQNPDDIEEMYGEGYDDESITATFHSHLKSIVAEYSLMRKMDGSANVVNCKDLRYIQHDDGIGWDIYIRMELLTPLMKALPIEISEATVIQIGKDLCNALILCKKHEIVHRDIKPQNIFVSSNGDYKLGDFGIAKTVEKTMGGTKIGTYKYMAPEVYNNQPYGSAADIYSLGLVLYWLLNERRMPFLPLPPEKLKAGMDDAARQRRLSGEKLPPPANGSKRLKEIVLKACAYDPKDRYSSAAEMKADLEALAETEVGSSIFAAAPVAVERTTIEPDDDDRTVSIFDISDISSSLAFSEHDSFDSTEQLPAETNKPHILEQKADGLGSSFGFDYKEDASARKPAMFFSKDIKKRTKGKRIIIAAVVFGCILFAALWFLIDRGLENDSDSQNIFSKPSDTETILPTNHITATQTHIETFTAIAGDQDGSVNLTFSVRGPENTTWRVRYSAPGVAEKVADCTGHSVTITDLKIGAEYTFKLEPAADLYVVGNDTLTYTAAKLIYAENLAIQGFHNGALLTTWSAPEGITVNSWSVRCYNNDGYSETFTVTESQIAIEGLDPAQGYTVEVKAEGMTVFAYTSIKANSITFKDLLLDDSTPGQLVVTWNYEGTAPSDGWRLFYTINGGEPHVIHCEQSACTITPLLPGGHYTISFQLPDDITVFGGTKEYDVPAAPAFNAYGVSAEDFAFHMCYTPVNPAWKWYDLLETDFTTKFKVGEKASFVMVLNKLPQLPEEEIETLFVVRDETGNILSINQGCTRTWKYMWSEFNNRYATVLNIPTMPQTPGDYTVEIYCNNSWIFSGRFEICDQVSPSPGTVPCERIQLSNQHIIFVSKGDRWTLMVSLTPKNTTDKVSFQSSDPSIATVSKDGLITAVGNGRTTIVVTCGTVTQICQVECSFGDTSESVETGFVFAFNTKYVDGITGKYEVTLMQGDIWRSYTSELSVSPEDINWLTDNSNICVVNNGIVTAVGPGKTEIHAEYNGVVYTCIVRCIG